MVQHLIDDTLEIGRSAAGVINTKLIKLSTLISEILFEISDLTNSDLSTNIRCDQSLNQLITTLRKYGFYLSIDQKLWDKELLLDKKKVKQILRNLLINALRYKNTRVSLEVDEMEGSLFFELWMTARGYPLSITREYSNGIFNWMTQR